MGRTGEQSGKYDNHRVARIRDELIPCTEKGFGGPAHRAPVEAAALVGEHLHATDGHLGTPRAVLNAAALRNNVRVMADYCASRGVSLYPHGKTTMAPQLWAEQLDAGAQGITVANVTQARVAREFGVRDLLVANEIVDEGDIRWVGEQLAGDPGSSLLCYVDSLAGVERLDTTLRRRGYGRSLPVLLEIGHAAGRTGTRSTEAALEVAAAVGRAPALELAGVAGYEGSIAAPTLELTLTLARDYLGRVGALTGSLLAQGAFVRRPVLSAGGSAYFDVVIEVLGASEDWELVLRSGCYLTHDHGLYERVSPFERSTGSGVHLEPALEVQVPVLSVPEPTVAVLGVGRRDVSFDAGNPVVLDGAAAGTVVDRLFDQHAVLSLQPDGDLVPGDVVRLGVSHPCTTFDKWRWLPVVDEQDRIVEVVRTFF